MQRLTYLRKVLGENGAYSIQNVKTHEKIREPTDFSVISFHNFLCSKLSVSNVRNQTLPLQPPIQGVRSAIEPSSLSQSCSSSLFDVRHLPIFQSNWSLFTSPRFSTFHSTHIYHSFFSITPCTIMYVYCTSICKTFRLNGQSPESCGSCNICYSAMNSITYNQCSTVSTCFWAFRIRILLSSFYHPSLKNDANVPSKSKK
jgi:hypothetical protein